MPLGRSVASLLGVLARHQVTAGAETRCAGAWYRTARSVTPARWGPGRPVLLVSPAVLEAGDQPLPLFEIKGRVSTLIGDLERLGSYVHVPRADRDYAISVGLRMLTLRHLVIETDDAFRVQEWNPAAERTFGYTRAEVLGKDPRLLVPPEAQAEVETRRTELLTGDGGMRLTTENLTEMNGQMAVDRAKPEDVANDFLTSEGLLG